MDMPAPFKAHPWYSISFHNKEKKKKIYKEKTLSTAQILH